jgi:hypothetical protein
MWRQGDAKSKAPQHFRIGGDEIAQAGGWVKTRIRRRKGAAAAAFRQGNMLNRLTNLLADSRRPGPYLAVSCAK